MRRSTTTGGEGHDHRPGPQDDRPPGPRQVLGVFKSGYVVHGYDKWLVSNVETILDSDVQIGSAGRRRHEDLPRQTRAGNSKQRSGTSPLATSYGHTYA